VRRLIGLLASLVMTVTLLALPEPAGAGVALQIKSARATNTTPGQSAQIEVAAASDYGVTGLSVRLHLVNDSDLIATLSTFDLVSGTAEDGVWRSTDTVTVPDGRVSIDVKATTGLSANLGYVYAGIIDNGRDVRVSELVASPDSLDSDHGDFRLTGRVVTQAADGTEQGVGHNTIQLLDATWNSELGYTTTDDQGYFSAAAHLNHAARVDAVSLPNATYRSAKIETVVHYTTLATRLTIAAPADGGVVGASMTLSGRLERQSPTGEWSGLGSARVHIFSRGPENATDVVTGADGTYRAQVTVRPGDTAGTAEFFGDMGTGTYKFSSAVANGVIVRAQPTIVEFDAGPEPVGRGATVTVRGRVLRPTATGGTEPAPQAYVTVQFSADGKKWSDAYSSLTDAHGRFSAGVRAEQDGRWRAFVEKDYAYLAAAGPTDYVDTRYRTRISGFNASPEPVRKGGRVTVTGLLQRNTTSWKAFTKRTARIYFRARGGTKWTYAGSATTDARGRFTFAGKAAKDGYWRATYAGDSADLSVTGASDYVDVR
jgi:hypothetical protein